MRLTVILLMVLAFAGAVLSAIQDLIGIKLPSPQTFWIPGTVLLLVLVVILMHSKRINAAQDEKIRRGLFNQ